MDREVVLAVINTAQAGEEEGCIKEVADGAEEK